MTSSREALALLLPGYDLGSELGRGGFGIVLSGRHRELGREVAIKQLLPALTSQATIRSRFAAEARILASFDHPHIVPVYDYVDRDGVCALVLEKLPGGTAWQYFREHGMTPQAACAAAMVVCAGLQYAHDHGVLHRDVKPENMLFSGEKLLKITDFGIAKVVGGSETLMTNAGDVLGTPAYMAPEQAQGEELGPPADVYAAAVMLYEMLSGRLPFAQTGGALAILYRHVYEEPLNLHDAAPHVPSGLAEVVMTGLARSPQQRFPTAEAFGVSIGEEAAAAWGPGWLREADVALLSTGPIAASAEHPAETAVGAESQRASKAPLRPEAQSHVGRAAAYDVVQGDLLPVREALRPPRRPVAWVAASLLLAAVMVLVALTGVGGVRRDTTIEPGTATIGGADPASDGPVRLDLSKPIPVLLGRLPSFAASARTVRLRLYGAGIPLIPSSPRGLSEVDGGLGAVVDVRGDRLLAGGMLRGELELLGPDGVLAVHRFPVRTVQSGIATVAGVLTVVILLALLSYTESLLRPMRRRGRLRPSNLIGLAVMGAGLGATAVVLSGLFGRQEPLARNMAVCGAIGGAAAIAGGLAAARAGRRAVVRRATQGAAQIAAVLLERGAMRSA